MTRLTRPMLFVATADPARSREFYQKKLKLKFIADEPYSLVFDVSGMMLRVQKVERVAPAKYTVLGWEVDDIEKTVSALTKSGVVFTRYPGMDQDKQGIWQSPSGAKIAWFTDPDGNILSLTQLA